MYLFTTKIGRLGGGGSDYAAFVQHIGIPAAEISFGGGKILTFSSTSYYWNVTFRCARSQFLWLHKTGIKQISVTTFKFPPLKDIKKEKEEEDSNQRKE